MAHSIHSYVNGHMAIGFTKWQFEALKALLSNRSPPSAPPSDLLADLPSAPPPAPPCAQKPCAQSAPYELPLQPIPARSARSYSSPSVETIQEVEHKQIPLRNIRPMKKKLGASKNMSTSRLQSIGNGNGLPTKFGGSNMCFSWDKDPDAWYTTMLNTHANELAT